MISRRKRRVARRGTIGRRGGISLMELLVALSIVAVSASAMLAIVGGAGSRSVRARMAVDEIATHLRAARNTAISRGLAVEVSLGVAEDPLFVRSAVATTAGTGTLAFPVAAPPVVQIQGWDGPITFDAAGRPDRSLDVTVGGDGHDYRLQLFRASGLISVEKL